MAESFPENVRPMLAVTAAAPTDAQNHAYEFKWDGFRAIASWDGRSFALTSRNQLDLTPDFPGLWPLQAALSGRGPVMLDGELVVFDAHGRPDFNRLQNHEGRTRAVYVIFDLIYHGGRKLIRLPYEERRSRLEDLGLHGPRWRVPSYSVGDPDRMLALARQRGYEGLIAKRLGSPYRLGERTGEWVKMKLTRRQEFVIGGWLPGEGANRGSLGSLILGFYRDGALIFAGKVGTGFSSADRDALASFLKKIPGHSAFDGRVPFRQAIYCKPALVCEVEFFEWTPDGRVRHPSFKGLRPDKSPFEVVREEASAAV